MDLICQDRQELMWLQCFDIWKYYTEGWAHTALRRKQVGTCYTNTQTGRQTDRQTDKQTDGHM